MTKEYLHTFTFGQATITMMTLAMLHWDFAQQIPVPPEQRHTRYARLFVQPERIPMYCIHIQLPGISLLVDACTPTAFLGTEYGLPGTALYPRLSQQLKEAMIDPEGISHVIITHNHFDHIIGLTLLRGREFVPCFPQARHYLGRADWEDSLVQKNLEQPGTLDNTTLAVVHRHGLLQLIDNHYAPGPGLTILSLPGETPGHQILKLQSEGKTLYCLGDLYHHRIEVEQPAWMPAWAESSTLLQSRHKLNQMALDENALLLAAHISTPGLLRATADGVTWEDVHI